MTTGHIKEGISRAWLVLPFPTKYWPFSHAAPPLWVCIFMSVITSLPMCTVQQQKAFKEERKAWERTSSFQLAANEAAV